MSTEIIGCADVSVSQPLPYFESPRASAGFSNPAENLLEKPLSLDSLLITRPSSTFLIRLSGTSMEPSIPDGCILVVDKAAEVRSGRIIVASLDGEFLVKELVLSSSSRPFLRSHNPSFPDIVIQEDVDSVVWGVVVGFAKRL